MHMYTYIALHSIVRWRARGTTVVPKQQRFPTAFSFSLSLAAPWTCELCHDCYVDNVSASSGLHELGLNFRLSQFVELVHRARRSQVQAAALVCSQWSASTQQLIPLSVCELQQV
jgi:hypothetical protein